MLKDIRQAEKDAESVVQKAKDAAEKIVRDAREEAVRIVREAEQEVHDLKAANTNEGIKTGQREAEKITADAQTEIKHQQHAAPALVTKAAENVMKRITENL